MSDYSLMNPDFVQKELADCTELYAKQETFNREFSIAYDEILATIQTLELVEPGRTTYPLHKDQVALIVRTLSSVKQKEFVFLSPRKVMINHYSRLLKDRRYRIATRILNLFK